MRVLVTRPTEHVVSSENAQHSWEQKIQDRELEDEVSAWAMSHRAEGGWLWRKEEAYV